MHEHLVRPLYELEIHLLYTSIVCIAAWALTSLPRASATAKYWIWVVTSLSFVLPVGPIVDRIAPYQLAWAAPIGAAGALASRISRSPAIPAIAALWLAGAIVMAGRAVRRIRSGRREDVEPRDRRPVFFTDGVPVRFAGTRRIPAVGGVLRPHVSLPEGIERLLTASELDAVLVHEVTHAKRRDNLIRLLHEIGACIFWFHPFVWMTGARISLYRELSCDESVLRREQGGDLLSALAKLAAPEGGLLLEATASSFVGDRLALLAAPARPSARAATAALVAIFGAVLLTGALEAVAHTACCFHFR